MNLYAVKFKYNTDYDFSNEVCLVVAETKEDAKRRFEDSIYIIFHNPDDFCEIEMVERLDDPGLMFLQRGTLWMVNNQKYPNKVMW